MSSAYDSSWEVTSQSLAARKAYGMLAPFQEMGRQAQSPIHPLHCCPHTQQSDAALPPLPLMSQQPMVPTYTAPTASQLGCAHTARKGPCGFTSAVKPSLTITCL